MNLAQALLSGLLIGGVYGLFSIGFSLAFGVMRIVNFAHGGVVMLGMYVGLYAFDASGIDLLVSIPAALIAGGLLGATLYVTFYARFVGKATLQQLLLAIALGLIIQVLAQMAFGPNAQSIRSAWGSQYLIIGTMFASYAQIAAFGVAVVATLAVEALLHGTRWGHAVRAVADDAEAAGIVGLDAQRINLGAFSLSCALAALAGSVLVTYYPVSPPVGFGLMPIALIATVIGGLGSVKGAFFGGLICGVVEQVASTAWTPALQDVPLYALLLIFLAVRPFGLFGRPSAH